MVRPPAFSGRFAPREVAITEVDWMEGNVVTLQAGYVSRKRYGSMEGDGRFAQPASTEVLRKVLAGGSGSKGHF